MGLDWVQNFQVGIEGMQKTMQDELNKFNVKAKEAANLIENSVEEAQKRNAEAELQFKRDAAQKVKNLSGEIDRKHRAQDLKLDNNKASIDKRLVSLETENQRLKKEVFSLRQKLVGIGKICANQ